jgi:hypothetical protein
MALQKFSQALQSFLSFACPPELQHRRGAFSFEIYAMRFALCAMLQGRANFFVDDLPYPLCSKLPGLKQEMGPPVLHIRYTMSGEAAI